MVALMLCTSGPWDVKTETSRGFRLVAGTGSQEA